MGNPKKAKKLADEVAKKEIQSPLAMSLPGKRERILMMLIKAVKAILSLLGKQLIKHRTKRLTRRIEGKK